MCHSVSKAKLDGVCAKQGWKVNIAVNRSESLDAWSPSCFGLAYMAISLINKPLVMLLE